MIYMDKKGNIDFGGTGMTKVAVAIFIISLAVLLTTCMVIERKVKPPELSVDTVIIQAITIVEQSRTGQRIDPAEIQMYKHLLFTQERKLVAANRRMLVNEMTKESGEEGSWVSKVNQAIDKLDKVK